MKKFLFILLIIMLPTVSGIENIYSDNSMDKYLVYDMDRCYGEVKVKVSSEHGTEDINIEHFDKKNKIYTAQCQDVNNGEIIFNVFGKKPDKYDIVIEYYLGNNSLTDKRTLNFNDIELYPKDPEPEPTKKINFILIGSIVFVVLSLFGLFMFGIFKLMTSQSKEEKEEQELIDKLEKKSYDNMMRDVHDRIRRT